jgi:hypothetical protein
MHHYVILTGYKNQFKTETCTTQAHIDSTVKSLLFSFLGRELYKRAEL